MAMTSVARSTRCSFAALRSCLRSIVCLLRVARLSFESFVPFHFVRPAGAGVGIIRVPCASHSREWRFSHRVAGRRRVPVIDFDTRTLTRTADGGMEVDHMKADGEMEVDHMKEVEPSEGGPG
jgi:hypothetical protein